MKKCTNCIHYKDGMGLVISLSKDDDWKAECLVDSKKFNELKALFQDDEEINSIDCDSYELIICHDTLDIKVNEEETLRQFIVNSHKEFYGEELSNETISSLSEGQLRGLVEHLDYLWTK